MIHHEEEERRKEEKIEEDDDAQKNRLSRKRAIVQSVWKNRKKERKEKRERERMRKRLANANPTNRVSGARTNERTTWFFVGISGSDLSNGKDGIGRRSNGKKRVLAEKLKELEKRKKRRKKGREGRRKKREKKKKKMGCESQSGRFIPNARTLRVYMHARALSSVKRTERKKNQRSTTERSVVRTSRHEEF